MILTAHIITGAAVAAKISNPILAIPLALLSHYFLDSLPQTEYTIENIKKGRWNKSFFDFLKVFLDIFFGILIVTLFSSNNPAIFIAAFSAMIPDGITLLSILFPQNKSIMQHQKLHKAVNDIYDSETKRKPPILGILVQIIVVLAAISLL
ncbi:MAG: hypothetical protein HYW69_00210 [Candidatus Nealsonbacteria bacterium]|nr:hypothetical protein [Candidatus Nealsonbacteria bacterium]